MSGARERLRKYVTGCVPAVANDITAVLDELANFKRHRRTVQRIAWSENEDGCPTTLIEVDGHLGPVGAGDSIIYVSGTSASKWIPMSERHPTDSDRDASGYVWCWVPGFGLHQMGVIVSTVSHWLPGTMPEPTHGPVDSGGD